MFRELVKKINKHDFKTYFFFSILVIITVFSLGTLQFTQARYKDSATLSASPNLAFFIVDVASTSGQIKLEDMIPSNDPYLYTFNVSNFNSEKHANVDLTYSIEIITTTNMPLNFKIYKGSNMEQNEIDSDVINTDDNGVYYRHLIINDVSTMNYQDDCTDVYTLWVEFPKSYMNYPDSYSGIIDLVDIKIDAEQVV